MEINVSGGASAIHTPAITNQTKVEIDKLSGPIHFIGIGGIGMSALARLALDRGIPVSGSDKSGSTTTDQLKEEGASIYIGHASSNVTGSGLIVVSTAISDDNPETTEAKKLGIPIIHRSEMLAELTRHRKLIGVSGTHGKTTTTGMVAQVLIDGELDPTVVVGGIFSTIGSNSRPGKSPFFVAEIDESDGTQVRFTPTISIVTNIETDHLENYPGGLEEILQSMRKFALNTSGQIVLCIDDKGCQRLLNDLKQSDKDGERVAKIITYGEKKVGEKTPDFSFESTGPFTIKVFKRDQELGELKLSVPGIHNKYNALASIIVGLDAGLTFEVIRDSLARFGGVNRRFQILGRQGEVTVVDDYAHHPTEVVVTLGAAKDHITEKLGGQGRVVAVFQPHQPGRLKNHWQEFLNAFKNADLLLVCDVYIARGTAIEGVNSERFVDEILHNDAHYLTGPTSGLAEKILEFIQPNDLVITIGAGDITSVGPEILKQLASS